MSSCAFLGSLIAGIVAAIHVVASGTPLMPPLGRPTFFLWLALDGLGVGLLFLALVIAPMYISGAEVALVLLLEVVIGPLLVGIFLGVVPPAWTIASASILLLAPAAHEAWGLVSSEEAPAKHATSIKGGASPAKQQHSNEKTGLIEP